MVEPLDIQNLLQTGYWPNSGTKSQKPPSSAPIRANQSSKLDPHVPRSFNADLIRHYPPPPSVEDEAESLAREHGSSVVSASSEEEPKFRGDIEQMPILLPVPEFNPERRFVILSNSADEAEDGRPSPTSSHPQLSTNSAWTGKSEYEANTGRKYDLLPEEEAKLKEAPRKPTFERRKSRQDLPPIETDLQPVSSTSNTGRARSAAYVEHKSRDYFDRQDPQRPPGDGLLSPIIKHSTKGRDRAYWDLSRRPSSTIDSKGSPPEDRRQDDSWSRSSQSANHNDQRRSNSTIEVPKTSRSRRNSEVHRHQGEPSSPRLIRRPSSPARNGKDSSPPQLVRKGSSPPYPQSAREKMTRSSSYMRRSSPPREKDEYWDDEYTSHQPSERRRRRSTITQEDRNGLLSPDQASRPSLGGRTRSRVNTPLASPRISQESFPEHEVSSPRSATYPVSRETRRPDERSVSPFSPSESSMARSKSRGGDGDRVSRPRANSRTPSIIQVNSPSLPAMPIPIPAAPGKENPIERRRSPMPPPPQHQHQHSRQSPLEPSPPKPHWQPPAFDPSQSGANGGQTPMSYRRYTEEVSHGKLPRLPDCPRTHPTAKCSDWLTLSRCENFNICPSCYEAVFADTNFKQQFVPAARSEDKQISCSFGSSPWYRIAWLMTLKYRYPDLRLIYGVATVASKHQTCLGRRTVMRIWYSIKDPRINRPLPDFNICYSCAKTIEALLPNLVGVFMPLDSPAEAAPGVCAMHYDVDRKRFVEYFDLMETASDKAVSRKSAPNTQTLADEVRQLSLMAECARDTPVANRKWYVMDALQTYTVCEECFDDVVWPNLEGKSSSAVARNFYQKPVRIPSPVQCQLYSERMREGFKRACRRNSLEYFIDMARERQAVQADINSKLHKLEQEHVGDPWTEEEITKLYREWKKWE